MPKKLMAGGKFVVFQFRDLSIP